MEVVPERAEDEDERALVAALRAATRRRSSSSSPATARRCCASRARSCATAPSPRRSCRRPGSRCSTGIDRFEGRSSLKTWIFQILSNRARTRAVRERRSAPFSVARRPTEDDEAAVDADRFRAGPPLGRPLGRRAGRLERAARGAPARPRDARPRARGDRDAAATPGRGPRAARRRGLVARRGLRRTGYQRRQPAHPAAPRAQQGARRASSSTSTRPSRGGLSRCPRCRATGPTRSSPDAL